MSFRRALSVGALLLPFALAGTCRADNVTFTTVFAASNEVPPTASMGTGTGTFQLNGDILTVSETFSGLTSPTVAGHIHCCAAAGSNGPVALPFTTFPSVTAGTFTGVFNLSTLTLGGGLSEAQFITGMESGLAYANIHTVNNPGGEIRGQLVPVSATPEPSSLVLLGTGALASLGMLRRRLFSQR